MFCHKCGQESPEGSAFCQKCGEKLIKDDVAPQSPIVSAGEPLPSDSAAEPSKTGGKLHTVGLIGRILFAGSVLLLIPLFSRLGINPMFLVALAAIGLILSAFDNKPILGIGRKMGLFVGVTLLVIISVFSFRGSGGDEYIQMVKGGTLEAYPEMTVGEALDNFLINPEWESGVSENDERFVNVTGIALYLDEEADFVVQFIVNEDDGTFAYNALEINELPQNDLVFWNLLDVAYSEGAVSAAAASLDTSGASSSGNRIEIGETQSYNVEGFGNMEVTLDYVEFVDRIENEMHELNPNLIPEYAFPDEGNIFLRASLTMYNIGTENADLMTAWTTIIYDDTYQFNSYSLDGAVLDSISPLTPPTTGTITFEVGSVVAESDGSLVLDFGTMTGETVMSFTIRPGAGDSAGQGASGSSEAGVLTTDEAQVIAEEWLVEHPLRVGELTDVLEHFNDGTYVEFSTYYDEVSGVYSIVVDLKTGDLFGIRYDDDSNQEYIPIDEWYQQELGGVPAPARIMPGSFESSSSTMLVNTGGPYLNMREGPGTDYELNGKIPDGTILEVTETMDSWGSVSYEGSYGWVSLEFLEPIQ